MAEVSYAKSALGQVVKFCDNLDQALEKKVLGIKVKHAVGGALALTFLSSLGNEGEVSSSSNMAKESNLGAMFASGIGGLLLYKNKESNSILNELAVGTIHFMRDQVKPGVKVYDKNGEYAYTEVPAVDREGNKTGGVKGVIQGKEMLNSIVKPFKNGYNNVVNSFMKNNARNV